MEKVENHQKIIIKQNKYMRPVKSLAFLTIISLTLQLFSPLSFILTANAVVEKVDICHSTGSHSNPYIVNKPAKSGDVSGHDDHDGPIWFPGITVDWGDIIPPFDYDGSHYDGKNWDSIGQMIWENGCSIPEITIVAHKIVCDDESDLPNCGDGICELTPEITATTAQNFVNTHPNCHFEQGWNFEWASKAPVNTSNPGDNILDGGAGAPWITFGPTDVNGQTSINIDPRNLSQIWVREILKSGYVLFSGVGGSDVSAELYCHNDVLNYDNYDYIDGLQVGQPYYCIAFNALKPPICGDGEVEAPEECDDGAQTGGLVCTPPYNGTCQYCDFGCIWKELTGPFCGDQVVNGPEDCEIGDTQPCTDQFNYNGIQTCTGSCTWGECEPTEFCGDEIVNDDEECDGIAGVPDHYTCTPDCKLEYVPYCGDGIVNQGGEECDDGNTDNGDGCSSDCTIEPFCGDGTVNQKSEECDDGNNDNGDGCDANCQNEYCGNGIVQSGEQCDDGNNEDGDGCSAKCTIEECGNDIKDLGEECELPGTFNNSFCKQTTTECKGTKLGTRDSLGDCDAFCGCSFDDFEYVCILGECGASCAKDSDCDDKDEWTTDICNLDTCDCEHEDIPHCGDGNTDPGEECDDGNLDNNDACLNDCTVNHHTCGNEILQAELGEECDDGNIADGDGCSAECKLEYCGDGIINNLIEQCDDGNNVDGDGCSSSCETEREPRVLGAKISRVLGVSTGLSIAILSFTAFIVNSTIYFTSPSRRKRKK